MNKRPPHNGVTYHVRTTNEPARMEYNGGRNWDVVDPRTGLILLGCFPNRRAATHYARHCAPFTPRAGK